VTSTTDPLVHRRAGHCGSGALRDILEHRGLRYGEAPLSEGAVFGLAGGLGCFFAEFPSIKPPFYLVGRTGDLERDIAPNLGAGLDVRHTDDAAEGWSWVVAEVDAGRPPMVWADIARLEYLRVKMSNTRHDIVVADYDLDAGIAWIADNDRDELQACSLESLAAARHSDGFPGPNRHTTFIYNWPAELPGPDVACRAGLTRAIANMRHQPPAVGGLPGAAGLAAIDAFADSYPRWPETFEGGLDDALGGLWVFIVKAGTAGAMFRSLHLTFLDDFAELLGDERLRRAASVYRELTEAWIELAEAAKARDHGAGSPLVQRIRELEHAGVAAMEAAL
jgi:hypothetical protein